jgi:RNA polymerase sigma-70 factor (ECF subfamily)
MSGTRAEASRADAESLERLLVRIGTGDRAAYSCMYASWAPRVRAYLGRQVRDNSALDELVQEVMVRVWRHASRYDPVRASGATWIFTIARNARIDTWRKERHFEPDILPVSPPSAEESASSREESAAILAAIETLPAEQAAVIRGAYFDERPLAEMAGEAGVALGTVKSRVRLALARMRSVL